MAKKNHKVTLIKELFEVVSTVVGIAKDTFSIYTQYRKLKKIENCDCDKKTDEVEEETVPEEEDTDIVDESDEESEDDE